MSKYYKKYYENNKERISELQRYRYKTDTEYRLKMRKSAILWYAKSKLKKVRKQKNCICCGIDITETRKIKYCIDCARKVYVEQHRKAGYKYWRKTRIK